MFIAGCPGGWSEYKGNCYKKFPRTTWNRARDACANIESTLTEIKDEEENNFIKERFRGNNWLGLSRCIGAVPVFWTIHLLCTPTGRLVNLTRDRNIDLG